MEKHLYTFYSPNTLISNKEVAIKEIMRQYPEGSYVICLNSKSNWYEANEVYMIGYDEIGDYGIKDKSGDVLSFGLLFGYRPNDEIFVSRFEPKCWKVVSDFSDEIVDLNFCQLFKQKNEESETFFTPNIQKIVPLNDDNFLEESTQKILNLIQELDETVREKYPPRTRVVCISDLARYKKGEIYYIGEDSYGDYGVLDREGDVLDYGYLSCSEYSPELSYHNLFSLKNWVVIKD